MIPSVASDARLFQDLSPLGRPAFGPGPGAAPSGGGVRLREAAVSFVDALREGERTAVLGLAGRADAQSVVTALAATEIAVQTAVTLRDKVVEAYQEILRMPV